MGLWSKLFGTKEEPKSDSKEKNVRVPVKPTSAWEPVTVKKYSSVKGYGFLVGKPGEKDVFIHSSTLERCGIKSLQEGQRLEIRWGTAPKGREAVEARLLQ